MPPPNAENTIMAFQRAALSEEASRLAEAILAVRNIRARTQNEESVFTDDERVILENLPMFAAIAKDGALLRYFINHEISVDEWEAMRVAVHAGDNKTLADILKRYGEFRSQFESWVAHLDQDAVTALADALEHINDPTAFERAQGITEKFVEFLNREKHRTVED